MKKFLVVGMILIGFLFLKVNGYAEEKEDRVFLGLGAGKIHTDARKQDSTDYGFDFSVIFQDGRWRAFIESRAIFYEAGDTEFSITFNRMLWRKISYTTVHTGDGIWKKPALIGLFLGAGPCSIKTNSEKGYSNFVVNLGIKAIYSIIHFDVRMNWSSPESLKPYLSISFGIIL